MFDVVVVDTGGVFDEYVLQALDHTDRLVLVGTLDIPALKSLKLAAGTLDLLNLPRERWSLVLNRADAKVGLSAGEFEETLGLKATVTLPSSRDVLTAVNRGEAIVRANRGHQVSKALVTLAESLVPTAPGSAPASASTPDPAEAGEPSTHARRGAPRRGLRSWKVA
jgi:pilus assembly protein CpaE